MNLGFAALYIAFAAVALWLLGEVLLQHRAPLPWRVLALAGFAGVAGGVVLGSVPLIAGGALGFGAGQAMVTRSVKRAERWYWSLRREDGSVPGPLGRLPLVGGAAGSGQASDEPAEPVGEVGPVEEVPAAAAPADAPTQSWDAVGYGPPEEEPALYQPQPLNEDSDGYGVYTGAAAQHVRDQYAAGYGYEGYQQQAGQETYPPYEQPYPEYAAASYDAQGGYDPLGSYGAAVPQQPQYGQQEAYGQYAQSGSYATQAEYPAYQQQDTYQPYVHQEQYAYQQGYQEPYAGGQQEAYPGGQQEAYRYQQQSGPEHPEPYPPQQY